MSSSTVDSPSDEEISSPPPTEVSEVTEAADVAEVVEVSEAAKVAEVVEVAEVIEPAEPEVSAFRSLGLSESLVQTVEKSGYTTPTPIQEKAIPLLLEGRDVLGQAQTGTGKTAAFALPLLDRVDVYKKRPQVLVLAPTRELSIQVAESFEKYSKGLQGLRVAPIFGGQDYQVQFRALHKGVHIVVGTPGRVMDHMRRGSLDLTDLQCLVLDEADEMLRMGFAEDVEWVLQQAPKERQMALFSATMPQPIRQIANKYLNGPANVTITQRTATADTIRQRYIVARPHQKQIALTRILESESTDGVLVFVKTRSSTEPLAEHLSNMGLRAAALNGDMAQGARQRIVEGLRSGKIDIIVATDVAARGLDVQRISHVINYDLPHDSEAYVHRIGRTGRAGRTGEAILFMHPRERRLLSRIEQATRQPIEAMQLPSNRAINKQRIARFHERITEGLAHKDIDSFKSVVEQYQRTNDVPIELMAASLAVLANGEAPMFVKNEPEPSFSNGFDRESQGSRRSDNSRSSEGNRSFDNRRMSEEMDTYRIEVGRAHQVQPGNIVGAIANEAGVASRHIGKIKIYDEFSTVDLPKGAPPEMLNLLKNVFVAGRRLNISRLDGSQPRPSRSDFSNRSSGQSKPKSKKNKRANDVSTGA